MSSIKQKDTPFIKELEVRYHESSLPTVPLQPDPCVEPFYLKDVEDNPNSTEIIKVINRKRAITTSRSAIVTDVVKSPVVTSALSLLNRETGNRQIELHLIRHGQSLANAQGICQGYAGNSILSEIGEQQALLCGELLREHTYERVYTSDLARAHSTCQQILSVNHFTAARPVVLDILRERKSKYENFKYKEIPRENNKDTKTEGGFLEADDEFRLRQEAFLKILFAETIKQEENSAAVKVMVCTHGVYIRFFLKQFCEILRTPIKNASVHVVVISWNLDISTGSPSYHFKYKNGMNPQHSIPISKGGDSRIYNGATHRLLEITYQEHINRAILVNTVTIIPRSGSHQVTTGTFFGTCHAYIEWNSSTNQPDYCLIKLLLTVMDHYDQKYKNGGIVSHQWMSLSIVEELDHELYVASIIEHKRELKELIYQYANKRCSLDDIESQLHRYLLSMKDDTPEIALTYIITSVAYLLVEILEIETIAERVYERIVQRLLQRPTMDVCGGFPDDTIEKEQLENMYRLIRSAIEVLTIRQYILVQKINDTQDDSQEIDIQYQYDLQVIQEDLLQCSRELLDNDPVMSIGNIPLAKQKKKKKFKKRTATIKVSTKGKDSLNKHPPGLPKEAFKDIDSIVQWINDSSILSIKETPKVISDTANISDTKAILKATNRLSIRRYTKADTGFDLHRMYNNRSLEVKTLNPVKQSTLAIGVGSTDHVCNSIHMKDHYPEPQPRADALIYIVAQVSPATLGDYHNQDPMQIDPNYVVNENIPSVVMQSDGGAIVSVIDYRTASRIGGTLLKRNEPLYLTSASKDVLPSHYYLPLRVTVKGINHQQDMVERTAIVIFNVNPKLSTGILLGADSMKILGIVNEYNDQQTVKMFKGTDTLSVPYVTQQRVQESNSGKPLLSVNTIKHKVYSTYNERYNKVFSHPEDSTIYQIPDSKMSEILLESQYAKANRYIHT